MNILKVKKILILLGAMSMLIMASKNLYTTVSVPAITELQRISGEIHDYSCIRNSKHGDHFNFKLIGDSESIIMSRIIIDCNVLIPELEKHQFKIDVWVDSNAALPLGYAMLIDNKLYESFMLGVTNDKQVKLLPFLMIITSFGMLMSLFIKKPLDRKYYK